ncbi:hypothetical protein ACC686_32740 [Rhizobium johnstonii]
MKIKARLPDIPSYQGLNHAAQIPCGKAAAALRNLEQPSALIIRYGMQQTVAATDLVPGDLLMLESGTRASPSDALRLR